METKVCIRCGKELPKTDEYFQSTKSNKDGLRGECKECTKERMKQYYAKHQELLTEKAKQYRKDNKEYISEWKKEYGKNNEQLVEHKKQYYQNNKKKIHEHNSRYYQANKEATILRSKQYYETNKENIIKSNTEYHKQYRQENSEKYRIHCQKRRAKIRKLPYTLTLIQWEETKLHFDNKCAYCGKEVPLVQEHFIALSKGGEYTHNNILPACKNCNSSKNNKDFFQWYLKYKYFSKKRERYILEFLNYKNKI